jgi:hypothetical protein
MIRKANAVWRGTGRSGNWELSTESGVLAKTPYSYRTSFENRVMSGFFYIGLGEQFERPDQRVGFVGRWWRQHNRSVFYCT